MPVGIWNLEWLNHNSQRSYPLSDDATKTDLTGTFKLPDDFILELYFPAHAGVNVDVDQFFLASISIFATGYNISIGYNSSDGVAIVASAIISKVTHVPNTTYSLPGVYPFDDSVGKLVIGQLGSIDLQPTGQFSFDINGGGLDSDCIRPMIRGIQSLRVLNNGELSDRLTGHVILSSGSNMQISVTPGSQATDTSPAVPAEVRFDAIDGAGLTEQCACEGTIGPPIRRINGVSPLPNGDFSLTGDSCLTINPLSNGLQLNDSCSSPCCGCAELEYVTQELQILGTGEATLQSFVDQLALQLNTFSQIILGSRLNDQGCIQC
jgi:hypothetical protein